MTKMEYLSLIEEIRTHDRLYYVENHPLISDYAYDQLYKKLEKIEQEHPEWVLETSPTQRVRDPLRKGFLQEKHVSPMLSLANTYSKEEVEAFIHRVHKLLEKEKVEFCAELKIDGVAVSVRYEKGVFVRALTRGDGKKGDNISQNMRTILSLPLVLSGKGIPDVLEVRGEVFMPKKIFEKINQEKEKAGEEVLANPRNAAAGSLKLLDPQEVKERKLSLFFYGVAEGEIEGLATQSAVHRELKKWGLPGFHQEHIAHCKSLEEILKFAEKIEKLRDHLPFDIDGIVIKVDSRKEYDHLGTTGNSPRWAVAYKFAPEQAETRILDITVQVGRTGVLTPVAELEPVFLAGSTIARATLHNQEEIERKDIRVGDFVVIEKGGDVIPKVVSVHLKKREPQTHPWKMPTCCPCCGTPVVHYEGEVAVRCPNTSSCQEQKIRILTYFASKAAMDIDHLGEKVVEQLVKKGFVSSMSDLYKLSSHDLAQLEGFKEKSIHNLLSSIEKSKQVSLAKFIFALGIRYVGEESAEKIAEEVGSIEKLIEMSKEELLNIEGIGEKTAEAIFFYFQDSHHCEEVKKLQEAGVKPESSKKIKTHNPFFSGKTFVLTGTLQGYSRQEATSLIKERGGKVTGSISQKTDYLLFGENPGSKLDKAKELGVELLPEEEFKQALFSHR